MTFWQSMDDFILNESILKEINTEYSLEGLLMKLQYFGCLMRRDNSLENIPMLGKIEGKRRRGRQRMRWLDSIINSMDMNLSKLPETVKDRGAWHAAIHQVVKSQIWFSEWTTALVVSAGSVVVEYGLSCSKVRGIFPVLQYLLEFAQIHVNWIDDAI